MKRNFIWSILCFLILCCSCSSYDYEKTIMKDYEKAYVRSPYYNPEDLYLTKLILISNGGDYFEVYANWIGKDVEQFSLEILPIQISITMNRHKSQFLTDFYDGEIVVQ